MGRLLELLERIGIGIDLRIDRPLQLLQASRRCGQEELLLITEVAVDGSLANSGLVGDLLNIGFRKSLRGKNTDRDIEDFFRTLSSRFLLAARWRTGGSADLWVRSGCCRIHVFLLTPACGPISPIWTGASVRFDYIPNGRLAKWEKCPDCQNPEIREIRCKTLRGNRLELRESLAAV